MARGHLFSMYAWRKALAYGGSPDNVQNVGMHRKWVGVDEAPIMNCLSEHI